MRIGWPNPWPASAGWIPPALSATLGLAAQPLRGTQKDGRRSGAASSQRVSWAWIWLRRCFVSGDLVPGMWGGWMAADHTAGITAFVTAASGPNHTKKYNPKHISLCSNRKTNLKKNPKTAAQIGIYVTSFPLMEKAFGESPPQQNWFRNHQGSAGRLWEVELSWRTSHHTQAGLGQVPAPQSPQQVQLLLLPLLPRWCSCQSSREFAARGREQRATGRDFCSRDDASTGLARMMGNCFKAQFLERGPKMLLLHIALLWQRHLQGPFLQQLSWLQAASQAFVVQSPFFAYWEGQDWSNLLPIKGN